MTTWTQSPPTSTSWTSTAQVEFQFVTGSPYGLLLTLTRPITFTDYVDSPFVLVEPTEVSWTRQEAH